MRHLLILAALLSALDAEAVVQILGKKVVAAAFCGDGIRNGDPIEACDGADLNGQTCASLGVGFSGGTLSCTSCAFNTSACTGFLISDAFATDFAPRWTVDYGGSNWTYESGAQDIALTPSSSVASMRYTNASLASATHWGKIQLKSYTPAAVPAISTGLVLRGQETGAGTYYAFTVRPDNGRTAWYAVTGGIALQLAVGTSGTCGGANSCCRFCSPVATTPYTFGAYITSTGATTRARLWHNPIGADPTAWAADRAADSDWTINCTTAGIGVCSLDSSECTPYNVAFNNQCPGGTCTGNASVCADTGARCGIYILGNGNDTTIVDNFECGL